MSKRGGEARPWRGISHLVSSSLQVGVRRPVAVVTATIAALALVAGLILAIQAGDQSEHEADARQDRYADAQATALANLFANASRDLRLARLNAVYRSALTSDPLQLAGPERQLVEQGIAYVGDRYAVDEICLIRRGGAETARWVGGQIASVDSLAPDESGNPFFRPASNLADDAALRVTGHSALGVRICHSHRAGRRRAQRCAALRNSAPASRHGAR